MRISYVKSINIRYRKTKQEFHCVKSVQIQSFFFCSAFSCIRTEYGDLALREKCPNTDQKKLRVWTLFTQGFRGGKIALILYK